LVPVSQVEEEVNLPVSYSGGEAHGDSFSRTASVQRILLEW